MKRTPSRSLFVAAIGTFSAAAARPKTRRWKASVFAIAATLVALFANPAYGQTTTPDLRIVTYNIAQAVRPGLDTVLKAIGDEKYNGSARPIDVLALQEVNISGTEADAVATLLNNIYPAELYVAEKTAGSTTGGRTQMLVYRTGMFMPVAPPSKIPAAISSGQPRQTLRYLLQPKNFATSTAFYLYNSHYRADNGTQDRADRLAEATAIRSDANVSLPAGANILYVGDFNAYRSTSPETFYAKLLAPGNGQAFDPINRPGIWSENTNFKDIHTQSPALIFGGLPKGGMDDRFDFQLRSAALADGKGLEYIDSSYHTFGSNGTHPLNQAINHSDNMVWPAGNPLFSSRITILNALASVSDHLPVVADYRIHRVTITETGGITSVTEGGANDTYTIVLNAVPSGNVTVTLNPGTQLTVAPATLTFTPANYDVPQTITVTAVDDTFEEGLHTGTITHSAASTDPNYSGMAIPSVSTYITDNDATTPGVTVTKSAVNIREGGAADSYAVVLNKIPTANVTINLSASSQYTTSTTPPTPTTTVTFTPANWSVAQLVTVTAVDDDFVEGIHTGTITHTATSSDTTYNGIPIPSVAVTIEDNDVLPPPTEGSFSPGPPGGEGSFSGDRQVRGNSRLLLAPFNHRRAQERIVFNVAHRQRLQATADDERSIPGWAMAVTGLVLAVGAWLVVAKGLR